MLRSAAQISARGMSRRCQRLYARKCWGRGGFLWVPVWLDDALDDDNGRAKGFHTRRSGCDCGCVDVGVDEEGPPSGSFSPLVLATAVCDAAVRAAATLGVHLSRYPWAKSAAHDLQFTSRPCLEAMAINTLYTVSAQCASLAA